MSSFQWSDLRFLNGEAPIDRTRRHLPHWQQDGKCYFVTFRLADSLPVSLLRQWTTERDQWLHDHPKPWSAETEAEYHRLFSGAIDRWLDQGMGSCLLREPAHSSVVANAFHHFDGTRYTLHTFVVIPNHVHLLLSLGENAVLADTIATWKRFSATAINNAAGRSGAFWMDDHFDRIIRNWDHFIAVARYIRNNPRKGKLPASSSVLHSAPWVRRLLS